MKRRLEGTKGWYVCWEALEGPFLEISCASFFKAKAKYEISGFGEDICGRQKVGGLQQKG